MNLYGAISPSLPNGIPDELKKIILFDPSELYQRIKINPLKRWQPVSMSAWPEIPGYCSCGCGTQLTGRQTRWANVNHASSLLTIIRIIQGNSDTIRRVMLSYLPEKCVTCGRDGYLQESSKQHVLSNGHIYTEHWSANGIHVDHILSVKNGGGGCWLGNYQFLCHVCNIRKGDKIETPKLKPLHVSTAFN